MGFINAAVTSIAPIFIATSPITSYADQIYNMHRTRSSAGFSLDIPLIMLVASILKIYYWFGAHYSTSLLVQALLMIGIHLLCLHVALAHRPSPSHLPFQPATSKRPYNFWQWRSTRPYWSFLAYFTLTLLVAHMALSHSSLFIPYTDVLGAVALSVEATLPLPQLLANYNRRGCRGFRPSVIANWIVGDTFKMWFFFASADGEVPWAFKICGVFQAVCDLGLGLQWFVWRDGPEEVGARGVWEEKVVKSPPPERLTFGFDVMGKAGAVMEKEGIEMAEGWERQRVGM
ncbi:hypothetical protein P280DRAFT_465002 [Massarina eburnea CBS 473.64]|uniref:PQ loop repeat protein n=1 Tax=Massarina eburnea CBS 473.64 TaxID=1395130 RepID=A0A6A6SIL6_9PLEO|nr:hypothetical protein P280DRAFT_465002 [Massarina eburnea CBS 473.64]